MNRSQKSWGWSVCQKLQAICMDLDGFVCKEPGVFFGHQMQTVGESVKKLYSEVMQDVLLSPLADPTQHIAQFFNSKSVDLVVVEASKDSVVAVKEDSVDGDTNIPNDAPVVVPVICDRTTRSGVDHSEQSDKISCKSSENHLDDMCKNEGIICDASSERDESEFDDCWSVSSDILDNMSDPEDIICNARAQSDYSKSEDGWGETDIIALNLGTEEKTDTFEYGWGIPNIDLNLEEKKTLMDGFIDEYESVSSTNQNSELENSFTRSDNKEKNGCQTESVDDFSVSSFGLSSCDSNNISAGFTSSSYAISNGVADVKYEDVKMGIIDIMSNEKKPVESNVIADGGKSDLPVIKAAKSKSYKKMIQDVFMSRKRLAKEYKQVSVLYQDVGKESTEERKLSNIDSEWELL